MVATNAFLKFAAGYDVSIAYNDQKTVQHAMVKCEGLLSEAGLAPHPAQKLSIKIELDTKPPGWKDELPTENNWRDFLYKIIEKADWAKVTEDVQSFLENPSDMNALTQTNILKLIQGKNS